MHAVRREQRLPGGVVAGDGARVGGDQRPTGRGAADGERDDRDVALGRPGQRAPHAVGVAQGLGEQPDHAGLVELERVVEVVATSR